MTNYTRVHIVGLPVPPALTAKGTSCAFSVLLKGDTFDWVDDAKPYCGNSFFLRCEKISPRKYRDERGNVHRVGSIKARVHHAQVRGVNPLKVSP